MNFTKNPFRALDHALLVKVAGGAARVTGRSGAADKETLTMLTSVSDSIKDLASSKNSGGMDPMMMMMMMMMMGGGGGGAPAAAAAAPPPPPPAAPIVRISNSVR